VIAGAIVVGGRAPVLVWTRGERSFVVVLP